MPAIKDNRLLEMRVFRAVVDSGGFSAAADLLGASQPFVSQTVTALERRLGVKLLHRSTRGHRVTDEGRRYLRACAQTLDFVEQAEGEVAAARSRVAGTLRVSAPIAFGTDQIVPRLPAFLERHPDLTLSLSLSDRYANLIEDNIDVAVRMGQLADSSLIGRKLCELQRIVVAAPAFVERHGRVGHPAALARYNCLLWEGDRGHLNRWPFLIDGRRQTITVGGNFKSSNGLTLVQLCLAGVGVMRMAEHLAVPALGDGRLVALLDDYRAADAAAFYAVFLPERQPLPRIRAFVDYLVDAFREPSWV